MIDIKWKRDVEVIAREWLVKVKNFFNEPHNPWVELGEYRKYFKSYEEKLKYQCLRLVFSNYKNKRIKKACVKKLDYWWSHLDEIILATPDTMKDKVDKWNKKKNGGEAKLLEILKPVLISYYDLLSSKFGHWLVDRLSIKTCPYCNRQFIFSYEALRAERPELDHFHPKSTYPLLCLSFFNLIPVCHSCNHVKLEDPIGVNPYKRSFQRKFTITDINGNPLSKSEIYNLTEGDEIKLAFAGKDADEDMNVRVLGIEDVYNKHTDYVRELIDKSMAYDNYARQALVTTYEGAGLHPQQVFDFVWGRHLADTEYEDRPLSKLTEDVLDLLNIRKSKVK